MPKKGQRKVNGVWVDAPAKSALRDTKRAQTETAADRRNLANRLAGWPSTK